jgi:hypothetical protein
MKFNELDKDYQEIAILIIVERIKQWEEQNYSFDKNYIKIGYNYETHKDYIVDTANNLIWNIEEDGTLDYELS